jgi:dTDP-4-amino-4,6-dideoxygalactose transaminase
MTLTDLRAITVTRETPLHEALRALDRSGSGVLLVVDEEGRLERTATDGDLRRLLLQGKGMEDSLQDLPRVEPLVLPDIATRKDALTLMDRKKVNHLPVLDEDGRVLRIVDRREIDNQILLSTPHMGSSEIEFIEEAFRTNWIAPLGPNVDAFEREVAGLTGVGHAAALSSGTAAIHLALVLLGVGAGDRVFCSSLTFAASCNPIVYQNAEPVFIDAEPESWNMSPRALERALAEAKAEGWKPAAIIVVNLYGQSADMDPILELCSHYNVPVIEDAAESMGATYKGRASGSFGRLSIFSFNGNKIITTSGGGMLLSDEEDLIHRARFLSTQAREPALHYEHKEIGYNYRMSNILAGVGRGQLQVLEERVRARRQVFATYREGLGDLPGVEWMPEPEWSYATHWLSTCTIDPALAGIDARTLLARLGNELIEARPVWKPMHLQPVFAHCRYFEHANESVSDRLFETGLCLPSGSNMEEGEVRRVVDTIRELIGSAGR